MVHLLLFPKGDKAREKYGHGHPPFLLHMGEVEMPIATSPDLHKTGGWVWPWSSSSPPHKGDRGVVHLLLLLNCDKVREEYGHGHPLLLLLLTRVRVKREDVAMVTPPFSFSKGKR